AQRLEVSSKPALYRHDLGSRPCFGSPSAVHAPDGVFNGTLTARFGKKGTLRIACRRQADYLHEADPSGPCRAQYWLIENGRRSAWPRWSDYYLSRRQEHKKPRYVALARYARHDTP